MGIALDELIKRRIEASVHYANKKGWVVDSKIPLHHQLSFEQILEIRKQPEWINAGKETEIKDNSTNQK